MKKGNEFSFTELPLGPVSANETGAETGAEIGAEIGSAPTPATASGKTAKSAPVILSGPSLEERLSLLPTEPGVYVMKDVGGRVIYVGKAKNLRSRVRSYFQNSKDLSYKTRHLVAKIQNLEFLKTATETAALLLENTLIKKWRPKYNIRLRDDKTYPYLKLDLSHPFPRPYIARRQLKGDGNEYFGPFPNSGYLRQVLRGAAKVFRLRDCRDHDFANRARPCMSFEIGQCTAPCVKRVDEDTYKRQIDEFRAFLTGESQDLQDKWRRQMEEAAEALEFEKAAQIRDRLEALGATLTEQVAVSTEERGDRDIWAVYPPELATTEQGESIEGARELFVLIHQVRAGNWVGSRNSKASMEDGVPTENFLATLLAQYYSSNPAPDQVILPPGSKVTAREELGPALGKLFEGAAEFVDLRFADEKEGWAKSYELALDNAKAFFEESQALQSKKEDGLAAIASMLDLEAPPQHLECVDISNMQGEANVASCVVFKHGKPDKSQYRHYNIRGFEGQDDFASMREVMSRRFGKPDSPRPDLLVIDGGKGQLGSVMEVLKELGTDFPVVSIAKARTKRDFQGAEVESTEERIFVPGQKNYIRFRNTEALRIMTHLRDEAHRFAIEFHRLKRGHNRGLG